MKPVTFFSCAALSANSDKFCTYITDFYLLRCFHICLVLPKNAIISLWELCYHDREHIKYIHSDKLSLSRNFDSGKVALDIHIFMCGTERNSKQPFRV